MLGRVLGLVLLVATAAGAQLAGELHGAIEDRDVARVRTLLAEGADPNGRNAAGDPALHAAVSSGSLEILKLLLETGVSIDARDEHVRATALHITASRENVPFIKLLLAHKADPEAMDVMGRRPLDHVIRYSGAYKVLRPVTYVPPPPKNLPPPKPQERVEAKWIHADIENWSTARKLARAKGAAALPGLLQQLRADPKKDGMLTEFLIFELGADANEVLVTGMFDENETVRRLCSEGLRSTRAPYDTVRERLLGAVSNATLQLHALWLLQALGEPDEDTIKALVKLLGHEDAKVRLATCFALGGIGRPLRPARSHAHWTGKARSGLRKLSERDANLDVRRAAGDTYGRWSAARRSGKRNEGGLLPLGMDFWKRRGRPKDGSPVARALAWLAAHQDRDLTGGWDTDGFMKHDTGEPSTGPGSAFYDVGNTGLALLCFLHANYADSSESNPYAANVRRGLFYLAAVQDEEGCFGPRNTQQYVYGHAIATLAMCEAYSMTGNPYYRRSAQWGIDFIEMSRNPKLAWRYGVRPTDNDTSVTQWMVHALIAGREADLRVDPAALEGARKWIHKMTDPDFGVVGYLQPGGSPLRPGGLHDKFPAEKSQAMTAAGMCVRLWTGERYKRSPCLKKGAAQCLKLLPKWDPDDGSIDMYYWYLASIAFSQCDALAFRQWRTPARATFLKAQHKDGSWDPIGAWGSAGGRVYSTALMTGALQALGD